MDDHQETISIRQLVQVLAAAAAAVLLLQAMGITCLIKFVTGISCPGCGMTRAWLSFLTGHPHRAFAYHPLFLVLVPVAAYLILRIVLIRKGVQRHLIRRADYILLTLLCIAMFICYGLRMADPHDTIVVCHPSEGIVGRVFSWLYTRFL